MVEEESKDEASQSVADRVLSEFIAAVAGDKDLAEVAPHLRAALLHVDSPKEGALRKALFGESDA